MCDEASLAFYASRLIDWFLVTRSQGFEGLAEAVMITSWALISTPNCAFLAI
jgi:hypothetical protein